MGKTDTFIAYIAPLAQAEYINRSRWVLPSVCIAQAALESGWNLEAKTLFGIKGKGNNLKTVEYINGKYETVTASFKAYPTIAAAVHGYYELITTATRYSGACNNYDYIDTARKIKAGGYATDPDYADKVIKIIQNYGLTKYDNRNALKASETPNETETGKTESATESATANRAENLEAVARDVIRGKYGNGAERKKKLTAAGYNYTEVQTIVNRILKG